MLTSVAEHGSLAPYVASLRRLVVDTLITCHRFTKHQSVQNSCIRMIYHLVLRSCIRPEVLDIPAFFEKLVDAATSNSTKSGVTLKGYVIEVMGLLCEKFPDAMVVGKKQQQRQNQQQQQQQQQRTFENDLADRTLDTLCFVMQLFVMQFCTSRCRTRAFA